MALRLTTSRLSGLASARSAATAGALSSNAGAASAAATQSIFGARRWKGADAGDVIGIDLGTTNSCVAIMVSGLFLRDRSGHKLCWG
jgi:hypothetical protein